MPSRQAILRRGFTFRHRGVHESRILALWELEAAAYAVIGQYLVVCLCLVRDPQLRKPLRYLTEKTRAIHLLRDRVRSFPITNNLLSKKEHVLLYKYRQEFEPDASEKKFLFLNSLAGRGPIAFLASRRGDRNDPEMDTGVLQCLTGVRGKACVRKADYQEWSGIASWAPARIVFRMC